MDKIKQLLKKMLEKKQKPLTPTYERIFFENYENKTIGLTKENLKDIWEEAQKDLLKEFRNLKISWCSTGLYCSEDCKHKSHLRIKVLDKSICWECFIDMYKKKI